MPKATLVYSTRDYAHKSKPLVFEPVRITEPIDRFIDAVFNNARLVNAKRRLVIKEGRYVYTPSDEYTQRLIRFKNFTR